LIAEAGIQPCGQREGDSSIAEAGKQPCGQREGNILVEIFSFVNRNCLPAEQPYGLGGQSVAIF